LKYYFKFIFILLLTLCFSENSNSEKKVETIPDVILKDINKKKVKLKDISKNYYVLFNFWNMACEPCKKEMKFLNQFHKKYSNNKFKVISINMDTPRSMSKVKKYVKSSKYEFEVLQDPRQDSFKKFGGSIMPFVVIVDIDGNIISKHVGYNLGDEVALEKEIIELIDFQSESSVTK
tara:strand:+ start:241 stop:771 length:531 start_codon:yes stop_codon:yes gene_type:complete